MLVFPVIILPNDPLAVHRMLVLTHLMLAQGIAGKFEAKHFGACDRSITNDR